MTGQPLCAGLGSEATEPGSGPKELYRALASSVAVVTAEAGHGPLGMTASSLMAVSLDPPLILVSLGHSSGTLAAIRRSRRFAVNLLTEDQRQLAARFAVARPAWVRFSGVDLAEESPPVLADVLAAAACTVLWLRRCGDHSVVLGRIDRHWVGDGAPLVWHQSDYHRVAQGAS